jgi:DNA-binding transcriptional ArsR family regulator
MADWSFFTNHARALVCIAHDPGVRLREIAAVLDVTERRAFGIVADLTEAGYVLKEKDGRRNRYRIQDHLPLRTTIGREPTIGEVLAVLVDTSTTDIAQLPDQDGESRVSTPSASARPTRSAKRRSPR